MHLTGVFPEPSLCSALPEGVGKGLWGSPGQEEAVLADPSRRQGLTWQLQRALRAACSPGPSGRGGSSDLLGLGY